MAWNQGRSLVIITGASRGLGQSIAEEMATNVKEATFVLISRDMDGLTQTEKLCQNKNKQCKVLKHSLDLSDVTNEDFEKVLQPVNFQDFDALILVHNAGSLGNQGTKVTDFSSKTVMQKYYDLNVFSVMILNSLVYQKSTLIKNKLVINISSLAAMQPFETWGSYCSGKAARDSLFKVMSVEEPGWKVLNYAPGPLDTQMIKDLLTDQETHVKIRDAFEDMKAKKALLTASQSAARLVEILNKGSFKTGDHVDYFDDL